MTPDLNQSWICAQIGSREHYSIPRVLHQRGQLRLFMTDFWAPNSRLLGWLPEQRRRKMAERFHPDLAGAPVAAPEDQRLFVDLRQKAFRRSSWEATLRRNEWFQDEMLRRLRGPFRHLLKENTPGTFFSYSYAARKLLRFFKAEGWHTVLGQVDPGPREEDIVAREMKRQGEFASSWERAPAIYWEQWREECDLADEIWVNSPWSSEALLGEGVAQTKIHTVPLVYSEAGDAKNERPRAYPGQFTADRPMRVLFLGQINIRKGGHLLLQAAGELVGEPVEFWMVGPTDLRLPDSVKKDPRFRWTGPVSREQTDSFYHGADLFILPTLSDGFALTQLEAQARGLPLLASRFCGPVVSEGINGLLLDPLTKETIAETLRTCLRDPAMLASLSQNSRIEPAFQAGALSRFLDERSPAADREIGPAALFRV